MFAASQGTVRKALNELADENLVVRRQGRGTFVASHTPEESLFRFFHLRGDDGSWREPDGTVISSRTEKATRALADKLGIERGERLIAIKRVRHFGARAVIVEEIYVSADLFPDLGRVPGEELPNTLYHYYQSRYGLTVGRATERLKAVAADADDARILEIAPGAPLLAIERTAYGIDDTILEIRVSRCLTDIYHYVNRLV